MAAPSTELLMDPQISIYKDKLLHYFNKNNDCSHYIDIEIIKKYYHLPFDSLPEKEEILQILQKIVQRYYTYKLFLIYINLN